MKVGLPNNDPSPPKMHIDLSHHRLVWTQLKLDEATGEPLPMTALMQTRFLPYAEPEARMGRLSDGVGGGIMHAVGLTE